MTAHTVVLAQTRVGFLTGGVPISTCTIMTSATPLLMRLSLICLPKTVAWQDRTSRRLLLLKSFRTMLPTFTKYDGYLWWTCGGRGSTILPGQEDITDQLWYVQDCDNTRRVSPFRPDGPHPPLRCRRFAYGYALDSSEFPCYLV